MPKNDFIGNLFFLYFTELEFSFEKTKYRVSENVGFVQLTVRRDGIDRSFKSYVQILTKEHVPVSAKCKLLFCYFTIFFLPNQRIFA